MTQSLQAPNQMTHIAHTKPTPEPGGVHKPFVGDVEAHAANGTQVVVESSTHQEQDTS